MRDGSLMLNVPAHWRIVSPLDRNPFASGEHGRPLRIVIDDRTAPADEALALVRSFAKRPSVEIYGTDPGQARRVIVGSVDERDVIPVDYVLPDGGGWRTGLFSGSSWARHAELTTSEFGIPAEEALRGLLLAQACSRHGIDALITQSPPLLLPYWRNLAKSAHAGTASEAAALLGLHLRAHNDYTVQVDGNHSTFLPDRRFYRAAALAALPAYPAWLDCADTIWRSDREPATFALLRGLEIRLSRALRARDYFQVRIRNHRPDDTWDDALFFFEALLLSVNGALDAAARFCHLVYRLPGSRTRAGWTKEKWRDEVLAPAAPELQALLDPSTGPLVTLTTLVAVLRNYIHGEALSEELHRGEDGPEIMDYGLGALAVTPHDGRRLLGAAKVLGGSDAWGLQAQYDDVVLVLPVQFLHTVVPTVLATLAELMATTDLPRLGFGDVPPTDLTLWLPDVGHERQLRLLTGLAIAS